jgi:hypothetical protein
MIFTAIKSTVAAISVISPIPSQDAKQSPSYFNPQMAIVGNFVGTLDDTSGEPKKFDFREIEFGFAADADPHLKVEAYIAFAKEDGETIVEVEEAFGRYANMGHGISLKVGKIAAAIGRVQRNHSDQLNYLNYPLVIRDVLGDEGYRQPGISVSYLLPGDRFNEFTIEALDSDPDVPVFNGATFASPAFAGRYRTFIDFSDDLSAQFGASFLSSKQLMKMDGAGSSSATLFGADMVMKWHPGQSGRSASLEAEAYWTNPGSGAETSLGYFVRGTYEVIPRLHLTAGFDSSEIPGTSNSHKSNLIGLTLRPTEFHHWRLEYERITSNFEGNRSLLNLQFQWVIGAHPAHKY